MLCPKASAEKPPIFRSALLRALQASEACSQASEACSALRSALLNIGNRKENVPFRSSTCLTKSKYTASRKSSVDFVT